MEEGSLIHEALQAVQKSRDSEESCLKNCLVVDAFSLAAHDSNQALPDLASRCNSLNTSLEENYGSYPWFSGGDGPVFGVHVTQGVPHLRARCWYGPSVADEWAMVGIILLRISKQLHKFAFRLWDDDDGHVLLIESAIVLPRWVDEIGPQACEYRCWVVDGNVTLIPPLGNAIGALSLKDVIKCLRERQGIAISQSVQNTIQKRLESLIADHRQGKESFVWKQVTHRAAVLLPRKVACFFEKFPSLVHCAIALFERYSFLGPPQGKIEFDDLVWTTQTLGRTSYALLRTLTSTHWPLEDCIPSVYKSAEVNRMRRTCLVESTPHLKHALQLGVRITAGLDYALGLASSSKAKDLSAEERILQYWAGIDIACGGDAAWLREAWMAGPNRSTIDLSSLTSCPLAKVDLKETFPLANSQPGKDLKSIIRQNIERISQKEPVFIIPSAAEVDDEEWMYLEGDELDFVKELQTEVDNQIGEDEHVAQPGGKTRLDTLLGDFADFVESKSDLRGVDTTGEAKRPVDIDPKLFLNMLHKVMTSSPEEIANMTVGENDDMTDPYFSKADYHLTEEDDEHGGMRELMNAMDLELEEASKREPSETDDLEVAMQAQVLSGLLESLDASEGASNPVRNILQEMKRSRCDPKL
jgi:hypothetical protein